MMGLSHTCDSVCVQFSEQMSEKETSCEPNEETLPSLLRDLALLGLRFSIAHVYESLWLNAFRLRDMPWHGPQFIDTDLEIPFPW